MDFFCAADHKYFGLQLTAITYSLPRVLMLWSLAISSLQVFAVLLGLELLGVCVGAAIAFIVVVLGCQWAACKLQELSEKRLVWVSRVWRRNSNTRGDLEGKA